MTPRSHFVEGGQWTLPVAKPETYIYRIVHALDAL
jgi:hypothetical protein